MTILAVSGLMRSGLSLVMRMLEAAGVPIFCDDEARGVTYETSYAVRLPQHAGWLLDARGKAVKLPDPGTYVPPKTHPLAPTMTLSYDVIWVVRDRHELARSQVRALMATGWRPEGARLPRAMRDLSRELVQAHAEGLRVWSLRGARILPVNFEAVLEDPQTAAMSLLLALGRDADHEVADRMAACVLRRRPEMAPVDITPALQQGGLELAQAVLDEAYRQVDAHAAGEVPAEEEPAPAQWSPEEVAERHDAGRPVAEWHPSESPSWMQAMASAAKFVSRPFRRG